MIPEYVNRRSLSYRMRDHQHHLSFVVEIREGFSCVTIELPRPGRPYRAVVPIVQASQLRRYPGTVGLDLMRNIDSNFITSGATTMPRRACRGMSLLQLPMHQTAVLSWNPRLLRPAP